MLESEAKTKWCPMTRLTADNGNWFDNRVGNNGKVVGNCLSSDCACWIDTGYDMDAGERIGRCGLARNR